MKHSSVVYRNCLECLDIVAESDHVMSSLGTKCGYLVMGSKFIITIIIINPLTARVVGAPQMILQPVLLNFSLFSTALWDSLNSRPVHSLMLSSHLFLCLPCLLPPFTVPCKIVIFTLQRSKLSKLISCGWVKMTSTSKSSNNFPEP